ncbi:hypothetical protein JST99_04030 [Candidatus Dependentiae bacterium]|nr:hypothetical protein [Candidatus Dependentiae bacterium]MCC7414827.1 hypothetical protein [Campylobacterota bacterium]
MQKLPGAHLFKAVLCLSVCITPYLLASAERQNRRDSTTDIALLQPIFISQSPARNSTILEAYLPKKMLRVKLYCTIDSYAPSQKKYSGYFFAIYYKKLIYSAEEPCLHGVISCIKVENNREETASTCLIGPKKSEQLFKHYQKLLNRALENRD